MSDNPTHNPSRVIGTETEFGIASRDPNAADPVANSIHLIGYYPNLPAPHAVWDYENENPLLDARGFEVDGERERPGPDYNRQLNKVLANGGRLYVDGAHPEYSTPECLNARDVVAFERVGERIVAQALEGITKARGRDQFVLYKHNSDGKGNSYGYHENYLVSRAVPFERITQVLTPFFVTRSIYAGSGKVGAENQTSPVDYQISQRADFFETLVDLNTMVRRPIINTRDEPHSDSAKYRRLHVIVGDANMAEVSTYLKVGTLSIVLELLEAGADLPRISLADPVNAIKQVSRDVQVKESLTLTDGSASTAIAVQRAYLKAAQSYYACHELNQVTKDVLVRWEDVLDRLERDPRSLVRELDWVAKRYLIESYMERKSCGWDDPRVRLMDFQYHDVRPDKGLYYTLERNHRIERVVLDHEIARAEFNPPVGTRAYFRGQCIKKYPTVVYGASWTSVLFDTGQNKIKRIPLMDPLRGTESLTGELLAQAETASALLAKLST